ncbi:uncharacterized protein LACBIDRAFT_336020 [Laccaria bicolor S238N-H82]|uniref:Predicted protein n=1 Tax=Laccaria bicolor (strain S238N-H82 / ATCC MYA-4686) TaxID=486041 RepID=B0E461_LACBS|nr:uncharacterized protein LACBIDRAFT_336020 [Laccaria bicolor S238N-H82]EDQ98369.1 predicted protein [Laccaria bicolor S238N-H82]|eukprot:XP_001890979.1 predicted protein [Laccaria bicolor S238N-H82]
MTQKGIDLISKLPPQTLKLQGRYTLKKGIVSNLTGITYDARYALIAVDPSKLQLEATRNFKPSIWLHVWNHRDQDSLKILENCSSKPPHRLKECERQTASPSTRNCEPVAVVTSFMQPDYSTMDPYPLIAFALRMPSRMAYLLDAAQPDQASHMVVNLLSAEQASISVKFQDRTCHPPTRLGIVGGVEQRGNDEFPARRLSVFKALHCTCHTCHTCREFAERPRWQFTVALPSTTIHELSNTTLFAGYGHIYFFLVDTQALLVESPTTEEALCYSSTLYETSKESYYSYPNLSPDSVPGIYFPGVAIFKDGLDHNRVGLSGASSRSSVLLPPTDRYLKKIS